MFSDKELCNKVVCLSNGNTYLIVWCVDIDGNKYYYLINVDDYADILFCSIVDGNKFLIVNDIVKLKQIMKKMIGEINLFIS